MLEKLQETEGYDLEERIAAKMEQYRQAGQELSREDAVEEIIADSVAVVFGREENIRDFMDFHSVSLVERVVNTIKRVVKEIRAAIQRIAGKNPEAEAMLKQDADTLKEIADRFDRMGVTANAAREMTKGTEETGGDTKFSIRDSDGNEIVLTGRELEENKKTVSTMNAVSVAEGNNFVNLDGAAYRRAVQDYFASVGNTAENTVIGEVRITTGGIKHLTRYKSQLKSSLVPCVRDVIEKGVIVDIDNNHDMRGEPTVVLAAPVTLDGKGYYMGVAVRQANNMDKLYHIHEAALIEREKGDHPATKTEPLQADPSPDGHPSIHSILASIRNYNTSGKKLSVRDQTETEAFRRWFGDSQVVNADGSPKVMYHGTPYGDFTVFKDWQYFTENKAYADKYQNPSASSIRGRYNPATNPRTYGVYLKVEKPFDTRDPKIRRIWEEEFFNQYSRTPLSEKGLPDWTDGIDLVEFIEDNDYDFDAIILDEGAVGGYGDDVQSRGVSVVVRSATQIKSATDNVGTFSPENPDIRYSLRDVDAKNDEMTRLMQENAKLRETVEQMAKQMRGEQRRVPQEQVRKLARRFKEDTGTRVPLKTLAANMQTAFDAMANARDSGECEAAMEMMGNIAQDMLEKSSYANRERYEQYEDMRKYLGGGIGLSETQWQEVKKVYGGNAAFRKAIAGLGLKVMPEGSRATLDSNWNELCEQWPEFFSPDTNEGDQVDAVVAAMQAVQVTYENPYGSSMQEYAADMAVLMYEEYLGMPEIKGKQERQIDRLTRQLDEARAEARQQQAQIRKLGRLEATIQKYRDAAKGRYERQAKRRKDSQDYQKMRAQVIRQRDQLMRKLREPRQGSFIPQSMNDAVTELMRAVDFEGKLEGYRDGRQRNVLTADALNRAKEAYLALGREDADGAKGPYAAYINGDLASDFDLLAKSANGKAARDLTMREMESLRNIVAGYTAAVMNEDRLFMETRRNSLSEAGEAFALSMAGRREHMKQSGLARMGANAAKKGLLKPVTVFGQFRGTPMWNAWRNLRNAENVHIRNVSAAQEYLQDALNRYGQQESIRTEGSRAKRNAAKVYTTADGRKLQLTDQELMTLYATWKREQKVGTNHLMGGGFTLANAEAGTSTAPIHLSGPDLQEMIDRGLTQKQKDYVDHMVEYLSGTCAEWGNEVTMQLYGVEKFHEEYYIPFSVNKNYVAQEPATEQDSRLKTGSFTKALTDKASTPLEIVPFTELWCQHVEKMSDYNAFVLPIEDMTRLMNYKTEDGSRIRALVKRRYGVQTAEFVMNFLSRLNGNSAHEAGGSWLNAFMSKAKGAAVTFNLSVAIQQAGSATRAMAEIDPKYFYGGTVKAAANLGMRAADRLTGKRSISSSYAELEQYAPIATLKSWGYFDTNMSRGMYERAWALTTRP